MFLVFNKVLELTKCAICSTLPCQQLQIEPQTVLSNSGHSILKRLKIVIFHGSTGNTFHLHCVTNMISCFYDVYEHKESLSYVYDVYHRANMFS